MPGGAAISTWPVVATFGRLYRTEGYLGGAVGTAEPFFTFQHGLPETTVFVAKQEGRVAATLSVVFDSPCGLPLEDLYRAETAALRARGRSPCEICSLAVDPRSRSGSSLVLQLFRCATLHILRQPLTTDLLVTLKPSHGRFYQKGMGFESFGALAGDPRFCHAETIALRLSLEAIPWIIRKDADSGRVLRRLCAPEAAEPRSIQVPTAAREAGPCRPLGMLAASTPG